MDLFFNTVPFHEHAASRVRMVPFEDGTIPVLAPDDERIDRLHRIHADVEARGGVELLFPPLPESRL